MENKSPSSPSETCSDWSHLRDRLRNFDLGLAELAKYRNALAVMLETADFVAQIDETDLDQLKSVVSQLVNDVDLQLVKDLLL